MSGGPGCPPWLHEALAGLVLYTWDCRARRGWRSVAFARRFGGVLPPEDPEGWLGRVHPEDRDHLAMHLEVLRCLEGGPGLPVPVRYRVRDRAGGWRPVVEHLHVAVDEAGVPERLSGVLLDLEPGAGWAAAHARVMAALGQAERLARFGIWTWEPAADRLLLSPGLHVLLGTVPATAVKKLETLLARVHPDDRETVRKAVYGAVRDGAGLDCELRVVRPDGQVRSLRVWAECMPAPGGTAQLLVGTCADVTEYRQAERILREANTGLEALLAARAAELEAANLELETFVYSVSHDLRQPLRHIQGFVEIALEEAGPALPPPARVHLDWVAEAACRMGALIEDLLRLSRLSRQEMHREPVDLSALARELLAELAELEPGRDVRVAVAPTPAAYADRRLMRIALANLLGNAWKFTAGKPGAAIEFGALTGDTGTVYFVRDTGTGFDPAAAGRLFSPFQRLHTCEEFPGEGVGLAIVRRIVHRHGGQVWAEGRPGEGAAFFFALPGQS